MYHSIIKKAVYTIRVYAAFSVFLPILGTVFKKKLIIGVGEKWIVVYVISLNLKKAKNMKKERPNECGAFGLSLCSLHNKRSVYANSYN